jgi:hypothetical protein
MNSQKTLRGLLARAPLAAAVTAALFVAPAAQAFDFERGSVSGSFDTTVSYGISVRTQEQDEELIGKAAFNPLLCAYNQGLPPFPTEPFPHPGGPFPLPGAGGLYYVPVVTPCGGFLVNPVTGARTNVPYTPGSPTQIAAPGRFSVNRDDGNLKYDEGEPFSNAIKITSELGLKWGNGWGALARASYFYDFENANRDDLTDIAREKVGDDFRLLDFFIYKDFQAGDHSGTVRLGRQVVSWGESTFIQNGINIVNPVDLSKLRVAGSELKEAFQPVDMLYGSFNITQNLSVEGMYLFEFEEIEVDPSGTYFSSNDFGSPGGSYVMLSFGTMPQPVSNPELYDEVCLADRNSANFGASDLFDDYTAMLGSAAAAAQAITFGCASSVPRLPTRNASNHGQWGLAAHWLAENWGNTEFGFYFMNYHSRLPLLSGMAVSTAVLSGASPGRTAGYFVEYPEDIQMYGISWNTTLPGGIAWQGEMSYRPNMPLQVDDVELLFASLSPLNVGIAAPAYQFCSQLLPGCGRASFGQEIRGWRRHEVSQLQMTFTKAFPSVLGSEQLALVGEIGATEVWDLPDQGVLRYEGEGTDTGGGPDIGDVIATCVPIPVPPGVACPGALTLPGAARNPLTQEGGVPTQFSWGYRVAARADYNNVFGSPITLSPRVAFNHDVNGITPGPGGNFLQGRKSATIGVEANYLNSLVFDLSYTSFFGGGQGGSTTVTLPAGVECPDTGSTTGGACEVEGTPFNQIHDRDFVSFTVKYSF